MASTYSTNLALSLIVDGTEAGLWGSITNTNLGTLIEQAISGYDDTSIDVTAGNVTISIPNGATGVARNMYLRVNGSPGVARDLIVPTNRKLYFVHNNSNAAVTVKVLGLTGVSVPVSRKTVLLCNGTDIVDALTYFTTLNTTSLTSTGLVTASTGFVGGILSLTGSALSGNGLNVPATNTLGFVTNSIQRGTINSTGNWNVVAPSAGITFTINGIAGTHSTQIADNNNVKIDAGYLVIPQNSQTAAYAPTLQDRGKHISITTGGVTVNANPFTYGTTAATTWTAGDSFVVYNNSASSQTITAGASVTFRLTGTASTGNRTVAQYGLASVLCVTGGATPTFVINGAGVT
jgi:hypothetical protein